MTIGVMKRFLLSRTHGPLQSGKFLKRISAPHALLVDIQTDPLIEKCVNEGLEYVIVRD
ncbi:hypothetical protein BD410DRAFT_791730 [Rickenella mellea]|uniref:Uncharacterized protein n=1 Tax=Rickenella mellea TaxID=50990 RepID=A0A4Y7PWQ9_9AGAM|nr:hypothetical protein BD410DRAFT_791730 [Rickenella mellea]